MDYAFPVIHDLLSISIIRYVLSINRYPLSIIYYQ